ncbi:NUDIX domain-containing protein [Sphingomonas sp. 1P06PA]|uniref:NUDIX domain-containing protein n=1 Tax=Sphingomonas sp. 1P06PA TaxID=554121 RepID=UPI0039A4D5BF
MDDPIPAATLVLVRDDPAGGAPHLLMIERAATMAFAAGAMVFPGGRIDPGDQALVPADHADPADAAARIAAIRETIEEVGIAIGFDVEPALLKQLRTALHDGASFGGLLAAHGLTLDLDALLPFARWCPAFPEARNFDTRFYLARAPDHAAAEADGGESVHAVWATAQAILDDADAGRRHIIFPTRRNLERLAAYPDFRSLAEHARAIPVTRIVPAIVEEADERWLTIPEGLGYPVTRQRAEDALRR